MNGNVDYSNWLDSKLGADREGRVVTFAPATRPSRVLIPMRPKLAVLPHGIERSTPLHEAGHYVIGVGIGLEVSNPRLVVGDPERLGAVSVGHGDADADFDFTSVPSEVLKEAALDLAGFYLAGSIAEALMNGLRLHGDLLWICHEGEKDLAEARRVLATAGFQGDEGLLYAAHTAERMLMFAWSFLLEEAEHVARRPPEVVQ